MSELKMYPFGIGQCPECKFSMGHSSDFVGASREVAAVFQCVNPECSLKGKKFKVEPITVQVTEIG